MKNFFKILFTNSKMFIDWLFSEGFLGMKKAGNILIALFIIAGSLLKIFGNNNDILNRILVGLLMIVFCFLFFMGGFKFYWFTPPKFIRGSSNDPSGLFDIFSHRAYLYGIIIFSFFSSYFTSGIILVIAKIYLNLDYNFTGLFYNLFFLTASIFTILYFMYHIVIKELSIKVVKSRISLYVAITVTITAGIFGLKLKGILEPMITYLGAGFAWLVYFIDKMDIES